jgi:5'-nucleotidase
MHKLHLSLLALAFGMLAGCATPPPAEPLQVRLLALNDYHGNLKALPGALRIADPANPGRTVAVPTGGVDQLGGLLAQLRQGQQHHIFVAAGDLVGATPLLSSAFHDEPTIEAMNLLGLEVSALGNHELDRGVAEALRRQAGGCHPTDGCKGPAPFTGARFQYLAANVTVTATGKTLFPPYVVKTFDGVPVGFIGVIVRDTPAVVVPSSIVGLSFGDEAEAINRVVPELRAQGVEAIVVLMHEGGIPGGDYNECPSLSGGLSEMVRRFDKAVDVVISGHTHRAYNCLIDGRVVTSAASYGGLLTAIDLRIDRRTRDVVKAEAQNIIVRDGTFPSDPALAALVAAYEARVGPLANRVVTQLGAPFTTRINDNGESELGQLIADAQLAATRNAGAQVALMNQGGVRAPLGGADKLAVTYADVFSVQPFANQLVTMTLTGAQLKRVLEKQPFEARRSFLFVSRGLSYRWDLKRPAGDRVIAQSMTLDGRVITPEQRLRVTLNSFIADGGDAFSELRQGTERQVGVVDVEALEQYLAASPGLKPDPVPRVTQVK